MKKIVILSMLLLPMTSFAFETNKPSKQLVEEYLTVSEYQQISDSVANDSIAQIPKDLRPEQRAMATMIVKKTMSWNATKDQVAELVANTYTKQELEAYIEFAKSPAGVTYSEKSIAVTKGLSSIYQNNNIKLMKELTEK